MRTTLLLGTALSGVATVLGIVSTAIPYWISKDNFREGLWQACLYDNVSSASVCIEISLKDETMRTSLLLGTAFGGVATVLGIVSTALPYWISYSEGGISAHEGLWKWCVSGPNSPLNGCFDFINVQAWARAVRAFTIIGIVCLGLGTLFAGYYLMNESMTSRLTISAIASVTGGVSFLLAVIIYGSEIKEHFSTSFYLAIGTVLCAIIAFSGIIITKRATGSYSAI